MVKVVGKTAVAAGATALVGGVAYYLYERNTEQPEYELLLSDGSFELRQYPALLVAERVESGPRKDALNRGFRRLADFIFAKSRGGDPIAMTAPVIQDREKIAMTAPTLQDADREGWRTRFVMPAEYSRATLPRPPEGVTINEMGPRRVAALRFNGRADDRRLATREADLRAWLGEHKLEGAGPPEYAFYNSPFIPPFLRRNEILIPVQAG